MPCAARISVMIYQPGSTSFKIICPFLSVLYVPSVTMPPFSVSLWILKTVLGTGFSVSTFVFVMMSVGFFVFS